MKPIVRTQGLFKFHGEGAEAVPILRDVSFEVGEGEFVCVMGPSGSGKSTLLHLLSGLDSPSAGHIHLGGSDLAALTDQARTLVRRNTVGYVFQFFNLMPNLSVRENIGLPLAIAGASPAGHADALEQLTERLGLANRLDAFPHQLSGGEMQRASIARALIGGQPLLLCDEPTGNLSQKAGAEVMQLLRQACDEQGRAVMLVTHNPRDAAFADRVQFLVDGELVHEPVLHGPDLRVEQVHEALTGLSI
ncbi:MAG: putative ABC transport system ATP-binding protein [Planctomycetota bacterium]|jgi:putative ABC transport system ATP-binding protein